VLLKNFTAKKLFSTVRNSDPKNHNNLMLQVALGSLCEWPQRIKRIVYPVKNQIQNSENSLKGQTFMVKVN
jgi:hypothetical protein